MTEEPEKRCNVDDIICQMTALSHLQGLQKAFGDQRFKASFPELDGIENILTEKITSQEATLQESLAKCRPPTEDEIKRIEESPYTRPEEGEPDEA